MRAWAKKRPGWVGPDRVFMKRCPPRAEGRIPEPRGFRWAGSAGLRVHLTRDDHARPAMFPARARVEHRFKELKTSASAVDEFILSIRTQVRGAGRSQGVRLLPPCSGAGATPQQASEHPCVVAQGSVQALQQVAQIEVIDLQSLSPLDVDTVADTLGVERAWLAVRSAARAGSAGELIPLTKQDRSLWDHARIARWRRLPEGPELTTFATGTSCCTR